MTKTEAAEIITGALASAGHVEGLLSANAFAQRIATALDALGMLQYADVADRAPIEPTGAKAPAPEQQHNTPLDVSWATQRQRT